METASTRQRKRRAACDQCHASKVKCPGGLAPCSRCESNSLLCHYSFAARIGKPPGSKNKKTLERLRAGGAVQSSVRDSAERVDRTDESGAQQLGQFAMLSPTYATEELEPGHQAQTSPILGSGASEFEAQELMQDQLTTEINPDALPMKDVSLQSLDHILGLYDASFPQQQTEWNMQSILTPLTGDGSTDTTFEALEHEMAVSSPLSNGTSVRSGASMHATTNSILATHNGNSCVCFEEQTRDLAQLRYLEKQRNLKVDVLLNSARRVAEAAEKLMQCRQCGNDIQMLMSSVMTFQIVFRWAKALAHAPHTPCADSGIQMGQYEMSRQEATILKDILVARTYEKLRKALVGLKAKVESAKADATRKQLWDFEKGELRSLEHSVATLLQTASILAERVKSV